MCVLCCDCPCRILARGLALTMTECDASTIALSNLVNLHTVSCKANIMYEATDHTVTSQISLTRI